MEWLNYNHLHYFWTVVQEGSVAAASRKLMVGRPSISMQLKSLEASLGEQLFERHGRRLELTEAGKTVYGYADVIFETGRELLDAVHTRGGGNVKTLRVGIADVMAKLVTFQLLAPAMRGEDAVRLVCREDHPRQLFAALAVHELDLVLSDIPPSPGLDVKAYNHVLGESTASLFAAPSLAAKLRRGFPRSLDRAPFLMPSRDTAIRASLDLWLDQNEIRPEIVGEFDDSALLKVFGQAGFGVFPAPTAVEEEVRSRYGVRVLGELEKTRETFYAISPERRVKHPTVTRIIEHAKTALFGAS